MKNKVNLTSLGIGIICFFLPWINITCSGERVSKNGLDIAGSNKSLYICLVVLAVLLVLYFVLFQQKKEIKKYKSLYVLGPIINLCIIGYVYISVYVNGIETGMGKISYKDLGIEISYGGILFIVSQIVSLFASLNLEEEKYSTQENNEKVNVDKNGNHNHSSVTTVEEVLENNDKDFDGKVITTANGESKSINEFLKENKYILHKNSNNWIVKEEGIQGNQYYAWSKQEVKDLVIEIAKKLNISLVWKE